MEDPGRTLRSRKIVRSERSPIKPPKDTGKKKAAKKSSKTQGDPKNAVPKLSQMLKSTSALQQATGYVLEESEEEFVKNTKGKRARKREEEGELLSTADVAEANRRAMKAMESDIYAAETEERHEKVAEDIVRYELKATLAKDRLTGNQLTVKLDDIKKKIDSLYKLQSSIKDYGMKRQEELLNAALKEVMEEKHANKRRRTTPGDSETDELDVSDDETVDQATVWNAIIDAAEAKLEQAETEGTRTATTIKVEDRALAGLSVSPM